MNQRSTNGIVLTRVDYGEADRIITVLTPDTGKLTLIAKGVRRINSKLAGGVELFSTSELTYVQGRSSIGTLVSARLVRHHAHIVTDIERTMAGYELIKLLHAVTEDEAETGYFDLLENTFGALDKDVSTELIRTWFNAQLLKLAGHTPNLVSSAAGKQLSAGERYQFDLDTVACSPSPNGEIGVDDIKYMRLLFANHRPEVLWAVRGDYNLGVISPLVLTLRQLHIGR